MKTGDLAAPVMSRLKGLAERYGLDERQLDRLAVILWALIADRRAPTAVRDPARAVDVHVADSLVALDLGVFETARRIADLGAGAGLPGLILAVARPASEVALIEAQARKCVFAEGLCGAAELTNVRVVCARAEGWVEGVGVNDVVLARALAPSAVVVEYAAPLLRLGGVLVDWRGQRDRADESAAQLASERLGMELVEIRHVEPYPKARNHHLHLYRKVGETPAGFPRRVGVARKRPLA